MTNNTTAKDMHETRVLGLVIAGLLALIFYNFYMSLDFVGKIVVWLCAPTLLLPALVFVWNRYSKSAREHRKRIEAIKEIPPQLLLPAPDSIYLGHDIKLKVPVHLPDHVRYRHVHIIGSTGTGKTMSTVQNFLTQDFARGYGAVILDGKGEIKFLNWLKKTIPEDKLQVFDLGDEKSLVYDPISAGSPLEAAQRLYSSFTWSEQFYASKSRTVLQIIFQKHFDLKKKNPSLKEIADYLKTPNAYTAIACSPSYPAKLATEDYTGIIGLRDQVDELCTGYLANILSPNDRPEINLADAQNGKVIYFRLQSSLSSQIASIVGKLLINHLNFSAGTAHRNGADGDEKPKDGKINKSNFIPVYLDEFATFACPEFADLISKARSAGYALHFSHQSIGDVAEVSKGFLNRITDNSATKIVMRINDPDSADFFARSFGTTKYQKVTQRITNAADEESAELVGEGSSRDARKYRAAPDELKSHPVGVGSVLIAHGYDAPQGASSVFTVRFPVI